MQKIGKEIKIGLAVIGVLVAAFGYILFRRLSRPDDLPPPAASAPATAGAPATPSDKPTVVSATESGRPADAATDGGSSSRSLFGTPHRGQASDAADMGTEARGSFLPAANSTANTASGTASTGTATAGAASSDATFNGTTAGGAPGDSGLSAPPENRFSQFGRHQNRDATKTATSPPQNAAAADNGHSLFTSGTSAPPAEASAAPSSAAPPSAVAGAASADPFQHKSLPPSEPVAVQPTKNFPTNSIAQQPSSADEPADSNPLRRSRNASAQTPPPASPEVVSSGASSRSHVAAADTVPPPVTSSAINVPSQYATPSEPINTSPPPAAATQPIASAQPINAAQPIGTGALPTTAPPTTAPTAEASAHRAGLYVVAANDNYWSISEKVYGTGGYFKAIYEHNRRQHAQSDRLQVGDVLDVPEASVLERMYPELCPKPAGERMAATPAAAAAPPGTRVYSVADGDTLYEIARRELGQASRWGEIYQLNHDQLGNDFGYLRPGTRLLIPADSGATSMAREPSGTMQR